MGGWSKLVLLQHTMIMLFLGGWGLPLVVLFWLLQLHFFSPLRAGTIGDFSCLGLGKMRKRMLYGLCFFVFLQSCCNGDG